MLGILAADLDECNIVIHKNTEEHCNPMITCTVLLSFIFLVMFSAVNERIPEVPLYNSIDNFVRSIIAKLDVVGKWKRKGQKKNVLIFLTTNVYTCYINNKIESSNKASSHVIRCTGPPCMPAASRKGCLNKNIIIIIINTNDDGYNCKWLSKIEAAVPLSPLCTNKNH